MYKQSKCGSNNNKVPINSLASSGVPGAPSHALASLNLKPENVKGERVSTKLSEFKHKHHINIYTYQPYSISNYNYKNHKQGTNQCLQIKK